MFNINSNETLSYHQIFEMYILWCKEMPCRYCILMLAFFVTINYFVNCLLEETNNWTDHLVFLAFIAVLGIFFHYVSVIFNNTSKSFNDATSFNVTLK
jgi:hypothetical protein